MPDIKNDTMRNIAIIILGFVTLLIKGQVVPLEADHIKPSHYTYKKDVNGLLDKYLGTWKGSFQGNTYEFKFVKRVQNFQYHDGNYKKKDELLGRLRARDARGAVIFNTFDESDDEETRFIGLHFYKKDISWYRMYFVGSSPEGCMNRGTVYIKVDPSNPNRMIAKYYTDRDILKGLCPPTFRATFPKSEEEFVLMKQ